MAGLAVADATRAFALSNDIGEYVPNVHVADETRAAVMKLQGLGAGGSTVIEFFDYNCPYCRSVAPQLDALVARQKLHLTFVNTPVLSSASEEAAKVEAAVRSLRGNGAARTLQRRLMGLSGYIDGERALVVAEAMGLNRAAVEKAASQAAASVAAATRLASQCGLYGTPSFIVGNAGFVGYPGPKAMASLVGAMHRCGNIECAG